MEAHEEGEEQRLSLTEPPRLVVEPLQGVAIVTEATHRAARVQLGDAGERRPSR